MIISAEKARAMNWTTDISKSEEDILALIETRIIEAINDGKVSVYIGCAYDETINNVIKALKDNGYKVSHYHWNNYDISLNQIHELQLDWTM